MTHPARAAIAGLHGGPGRRDPEWRAAVARPAAVVLLLLATAGCTFQDVAPANASARARGAGAGLPAEAPIEVPDFVRAVEAAPFPAGSPAAEPGRWLLAHVDVETTGLVPGFHEMIDLGVVMTDVEGRVLDSLFLRVQPLFPERTAEGARRVNDFDAARWRALGALTPADAADSLERFHRRVAGERPTLMVAFNSWFDAAFLDHLFRSRGGTWRSLYHYFVLDLPSMAWARGYRDLTGEALARRLGVADEPRVAREHTGVTGAMLNVRLYRALRARGTPPR